MNYFAHIIERLSSADDHSALVMAPNAPITVRSPSGVSSVGDEPLALQDIEDTLVALKSQLPQSQSVSLKDAGVFSFGLRGEGRYRVSYLTQRGSRIFSVVRIPSLIPDLGALCGDPASLNQVTPLFDGGGNGMVVVFGRSSVSNGLFVYALLQQVNSSQRKVIYVLERTLTFLMRHEHSVIVQTEVGVDVPSLAAGIGNAGLLQPDIIYVADVGTGEELQVALQAVETDALVILSMVSRNAQMVVNRCRAQADAHLGSTEGAIRGFVEVLPAGGAKVAVRQVSPAQA